MSGVSTSFTRTCWACGGTVRIVASTERRHICRLRFIGRWKQRLRHEQYLEGYEFAVRGIADDDPMVLTDVDDFGTGWAGALRTGESPYAMVIGGDA